MTPGNECATFDTAIAKRHVKSALLPKKQETASSRVCRSWRFSLKGKCSTNDHQVVILLDVTIRESTNLCARGFFFRVFNFLRDVP
jgi:hypothetical protein